MVVARLFIRPGYRALIRENSRFWSNSGIDLRFGLKGFEFDAETLSTIAAGGVALATPDEPGPRVATGHRFELSKSPREEWLEWQPQLAIGVAALGDDMQLPAPVLAVCRGEGRFSFFHRATQRGWLLPLDSGKLLGPADMLVDSSEKRQELEIWGSTIPLPKEGVVEQGKLASRTITAELLPVESPWPVARIKHIGSQEHLPEKLIITCGSDNQTFLLDAKQASKSAGHWQIEPQTPLDASWHGACVVSASDGYLVGIVVSTPEGVRIEPIGEGLGERD